MLFIKKYSADNVSLKELVSAYNKPKIVKNIYLKVIEYRLLLKQSLKMLREKRQK